MATIAVALTKIDPVEGNASSQLATWANMAQSTSDVGAAIEFTGFPDRTVQVEGTFGVGGQVTIQGSNDGTNFRTLTDPQGNALVFSSAGVEVISEVPRYVRPAVTGGDGDTDLTVTMLLRWGGR